MCVCVIDWLIDNVNNWYWYFIIFFVHSFCLNLWNHSISCSCLILFGLTANTCITLARASLPLYNTGLHCAIVTSFQLKIFASRSLKFRSSLSAPWGRRWLLIMRSVELRLAAVQQPAEKTRENAKVHSSWQCSWPQTERTVGNCQPTFPPPILKLDSTLKLGGLKMFWRPLFPHLVSEWPVCDTHAFPIGTG